MNFFKRIGVISKALAIADTLPDSVMPIARLDYALKATDEYNSFVSESHYALKNNIARTPTDLLAPVITQLVRSGLVAKSVARIWFYTEYQSGNISEEIYSRADSSLSEIKSEAA